MCVVKRNERLSTSHWWVVAEAPTLDLPYPQLAMPGERKRRQERDFYTIPRSEPRRSWTSKFHETPQNLN